MSKNPVFGKAICPIDGKDFTKLAPNSKYCSWGCYRLSYKKEYKHLQGGKRYRMVDEHAKKINGHVQNLKVSFDAVQLGDSSVKVFIPTNRYRVIGTDSEFMYLTDTAKESQSILTGLRPLADSSIAYKNDNSKLTP